MFGDLSWMLEVSKGAAPPVSPLPAQGWPQISAKGHRKEQTVIKDESLPEQQIKIKGKNGVTVVYPSLNYFPLSLSFSLLFYKANPFPS